MNSMITLTALRVTSMEYWMVFFQAAAFQGISGEIMLAKRDTLVVYFFFWHRYCARISSHQSQDLIDQILDIGRAMEIGAASVFKFLQNPLQLIMRVFRAFCVEISGRNALYLWNKQLQKLEPLTLVHGIDSWICSSGELPSRVSWHLQGSNIH